MLMFKFCEKCEIQTKKRDKKAKGYLSLLFLSDWVKFTPSEHKLVTKLEVLYGAGFKEDLCI